MIFQPQSWGSSNSLSQPTEYARAKQAKQIIEPWFCIELSCLGLIHVRMIKCQADGRLFEHTEEIAFSLTPNQNQWIAFSLKDKKNHF